MDVFPSLTFGQFSDRSYGFASPNIVIVVDVYYICGIAVATKKFVTELHYSTLNTLDKSLFTY